MYEYRGVQVRVVSWGFRVSGVYRSAVFASLRFCWGSDTLAGLVASQCIERDGGALSAVSGSCLYEGDAAKHFRFVFGGELGVGVGWNKIAALSSASKA